MYYDEDCSPEIKAAAWRAVQAAIAWGMLMDVPRQLPASIDSTWPARMFSQAIDGLATAAGGTRENAELQVRRSYLVLVHTMQDVNRETQRECPQHKPLTDLCHGTFAELFPSSVATFGVTPQELLTHFNALHGLKTGCPGFTATPEALAGCTNPPCSF
jgi:hypothetical protein